MLRQGKVSELELHKRALVLESNRNRLVLRTEWCSLRGQASHPVWLRFTPWLGLAATGLGWLAGRRRADPAPHASSLSGLLSWVRPLYSLWRLLSGRA